MPPMAEVVKVTTKGQLTLPARIRRDLGISEDTYLLAEEVGDFVVLRRAEAREVLSLLRVEIVPRRAYARRSREFPRIRDPRDAHVLAAAIVSHCDAIVTGDRDLVVLGAVESVSILRPSQARRLITGVA